MVFVCTDGLAQVLQLLLLLVEGALLKFGLQDLSLFSLQVQLLLQLTISEREQQHFSLLPCAFVLIGQ